MLPMIQETHTYQCTNCGSINIVRNGRNKCRQSSISLQGLWCLSRVEAQNMLQSREEGKRYLRPAKNAVACGEFNAFSASLPRPLPAWIKAHALSLPALSETLLPAQNHDVLELDELWSFVGKRQQKRWLWIALCRRTRQIVSFHIGRRNASSCRQLWQKIPVEYASCACVSDAWHTYPEVIPRHLHTVAGKASRGNAHVERWNNTLRQRLGRFVRKSLSFSKSDENHFRMTLWYIIEYNLEIASLNR